MKRIFSIAALLLIAFVLWYINRGSSTSYDITSEELQKRVLLSKPVWTNYNEDIKGQIGSTPVARWKGQPLRASIGEEQVEVIFVLEGLWSSTDVNLPILAREPLGDVLVPLKSHREGQKVTYIFSLKPEVTKSSAWLEIQYPHNIKRLVFDSSGNWEN